MTKEEATEVLELLAGIAEHMAKLAEKHPAHRIQILRVADELRKYVRQHRKEAK